MPLLRTEREGRVLTVVLDDPPANFMTGPMVDELDELVAAADRDPGIGFPQEAHDLPFGESLLHRPTLSARPDSKPNRYSIRGGRQR